VGFFLFKLFYVGDYFGFFLVFVFFKNFRSVVTDHLYINCILPSCCVLAVCLQEDLRVEYFILLL